MPSPTQLFASAVPRNPKADNSPTGEPAAMETVPPSRYLLFFALAIVGCAADLWTKHVMFAWRGLPPPWRSDSQPPHQVWWIWQDVLGIETQLNQGALFGMGQGKTWLFALLSFVAAGAILYWLFPAKAARDRLLTFALGLVMGGILGNLYDRLGLWGGTSPDGQTIYAVRDWILIAYGGADLPVLGQRWPNFNIADSLLVCGAGLLIWHSFRTPESSQNEEQVRKDPTPAEKN